MKNLKYDVRPSAMADINALDNDNLLDIGSTFMYLRTPPYEPMTEERFISEIGKNYIVDYHDGGSVAWFHVIGYKNMSTVTF